MNPLFKKYFFGELTDSEESKLEALLTESNNAAWEFGRLAEKIYKRYGLPDPGGPGSGGIQGRRMNLMGWILLLSSLLLLGVYGIWRTLRSNPLPEPVKTITAPQPPPPVAPAAPKTVKILKKLHKESSLKSVEEPPPSPLTEPPPAGEADKVSGNDLRVVVQREIAGPVVVRVLNSTGVEIRRVYDGNLNPGRWDFEWDGKDQQGKLVEPGKYLIEVKTESGVQGKELTIH